jgi:hypothetical protein
MGRLTEQRFSKRSQNVKKNPMKKMPTIPGHKGNANQNHINIPLYSC